MSAEPRHGGTLFATHPRVSVWGQLWALTFVVLIVLPFTAPFQTIDLMRHQHRTGSVVSSAKDTTKALAVSSSSPQSTVDEIRVADRMPLRRDTPVAQPAHSPILRL